MRPLSYSIPKPLISIKGIPILERTILSLENAGISEVIVSIDYKGKTIKDYLLKRDFRVKLSFLEPKRHAREPLYPFFGFQTIFKGEKFLFLFSDIVFDPSFLLNFIKFCEEFRSADLIVCVSKVRPTANPTFVVLNEGFQVKNITKKQQEDPYFHIAIHFCSSEVFSEIPVAERSGISRISEFIHLLVRKRYCVMGYEVPEAYDVNTFDDLRKAEDFISRIS